MRATAVPLGGWLPRARLHDGTSAAPLALFAAGEDVFARVPAVARPAVALPPGFVPLDARGVAWFPDPALEPDGADRPLGLPVDEDAECCGDPDSL